MVDEKKLGKFLDEMLKIDNKLVLDSHMSHYVTPKLIEKVVKNFQNFDLFTSMQSKTPYQDSGVLNISTTNDWDPAIANNEVLARWKKSHFQIAIPRDNQEANLDTAEGWEQASRLKGKFLETTFTYDNLNNKEFIVNFIQYLYRIVHR